MARNREDNQSFVLTQAALIQAAKAWPEARIIMEKNIATMRRAESCSEQYLKRWEQLIDRGLDRLSEIVLAETDEAQVLCSAAPLAGFLSDEERLRINEINSSRGPIPSPMRQPAESRSPAHHH